jgi:hypothetical protein
MEIKANLTYGLNKNNELVHISNVKNGLACECYCPNCKHPLIARNNINNIKIAHFAHYNGKECEGAIESALHLLAKNVLFKSKKLLVPDFHFDYDKFNKYSIFEKNKLIIFDEILLEQTIKINDSLIIVDAIGIKNNRKLLIEFANTHFIDENKNEKIKLCGIPCIEINVNNLELDELKLLELYNIISTRKYWISNPVLEEKFKSIKEQKELLELYKLQQKINEENEEESENINKYNFYKNKTNFLVLLITDIKIDNCIIYAVNDCPIKIDTINIFKNSNSYIYNDKIKFIIDNNVLIKIYGRRPYSSYIYVNNNKVTIYPSVQEYENLSESDKRKFNQIYSSVKKIIEIYKNSNYNNCFNCKFYEAQLNFNDKSYIVCKHPKKDLK